MQKQIGCCAFTAACTMPGPRHRMQGTNREYCEFHFRSMQVPSPMADQPGQRQFHPPRRRRSWATFVGVAGVY